MIYSTLYYTYISGIRTGIFVPQFSQFHNVKSSFLHRQTTCLSLLYIQNCFCSGISIFIWQQTHKEVFSCHHHLFSMFVIANSKTKTNIIYMFMMMMYSGSDDGVFFCGTHNLHREKETFSQLWVSWLRGILLNNLFTKNGWMMEQKHNEWKE